MKAGIVTLNGENYGNKLQNYALQVMLQELGYETKTIPVKNGVTIYRPVSKQEVLSKLSPSYVKQVVSSRFKNSYPFKNERDGIINSILLGKTDIPNKLRHKRSARFNGFCDKYLRIDYDNKVDGINEFPDDYSVYICGSDQIWNPNYASTSSAFFLQFAPKEKRIAFAPSFGLSELPEVVKPLYRKWLNEIPYLSVREEKGAEIIKKLTGRDVPVILDPTMCLYKEQWEKIEKRPASVRGKYVLTYFLGNEINKYRKYIENYAKKEECKVVNLLDLRDPQYYFVDPAEFVWLIHHANAMFTDSFHGSAFSLIFHTPFVVFERVESGGSGMSSRIDTLLKMTRMQDRMFGKVSADRIKYIDFSESDQSIEREIKLAREFLVKSLSEVELLNKKNRHHASESIKESGVIQKCSKSVRLSKHDCSGCTACANACPVHCIVMEVDGEGFSYPRIDQNKCIHCDKCRRICMKSEQELTSGKEKAYVAYVKDERVRNSSSSGGVFSALASRIIEKGGSVYGAGFNSRFEVQHISVDKKDELSTLRGSKYVQSNIGNSFTEIKEKLEEGKLVYFSGTPCQVDGLLAFLEKEYENLYTQDIICHGVPSPLIWKAYLQLRTNGERIKSVSFRDKTYGWHYYSMKIEKEKRNYVKRLDEDVYLRLYLSNVILRPSCYACHHKHVHRKSDFTLADYWGNISELKDEDKGISMLFVNTEKGQALMSGLSNIYTQSIDFNETIKKQAGMLQSTPYNQNRELFYVLASKYGMQGALKKWYGWNVERCVKSKFDFLRYCFFRLVH